MCASVLALHRAGLLKAAAHITGGGLPGNLPRVLPDGMSRGADADLAGAAGVRLAGPHRRGRASEMLRVFNCGIGMALVVSDPDAAVALLEAAGETVSRIGDDRGGGPHVRTIRPPVRHGAASTHPRRLAGVKRRVAILISGRGSNMAALIAAARDPAFPAEIVLVLSNRPDAAGLATPRAAGVRTEAIDHRRFGGDRAAHEAAIDAALRAAGHRDRLPRRLYAAADAVPGGGLGGADVEHPSQPVAGVPRPAHPCPRAGRRGEAAWLHRPSGDAGDGCGPILAQAAVPVLPGDSEDDLAERVLRQEHAIYPAALAAFVTGLTPELPESGMFLANPQPWRPRNQWFDGPGPDGR